MEHPPTTKGNQIVNSEAFGILAGIALIILACYIGKGVNIYLKSISNYTPVVETHK